MKILLVEDNEAIAKGLCYALAQDGYEPVSAVTISDSRKRLEEEDFALIILDIMLPDGDGFMFYQDFIRLQNIPTIFLTARDDEDDVIRGLKLGAEEYITKPFSTRELLVRIERILKKRQENRLVTVSDITFDMDRMTVTRKGEPLSLTSLELKILHLLFLRLGKVVTRNEILERIWEWTGNDVNDNTVTVYMKRIRQKLDCDIIKTLKGIGYLVDYDEK